ncbi:MAG TPA: DUF4189 domain-containing protein [Candidatus Acidoferrum sp.]|nr:DUF4189 domain-containing protein [Candidatus Acidoferrum sp.]
MDVSGRLCRSIFLLLAAMPIVAAWAIGDAAADEVEISRDALAAFQHYQTLEQPQFFALSADGKRYGYSYCPGGLCPQRTPPRQLALDACREAGGRDCRIIAAGKQATGTFSPFGKLTEDPLAEHIFRAMRDLVPREQFSDEQIRAMIAAAMYSRHGALAYSPTLDKWGLASDMENRPMARETALQRCDAADCAVLVDMGPETVCVAYGSGSGSPTYATGKTDFSARKAVERQCAATTKGCSTIAAACSGGVLER